MKTVWDDFDPSVFLSHLRNTSFARSFCRAFIKKEVGDGNVDSIGEFGFGGLNERIAMDDFLTAHPEIEYLGYERTQRFINYAKKRFSKDAWFLHDVTHGPVSHILDLVYVQHVLEHCGGLSPALGNILDSTQRTCLVIFHIPVGSVERVDFSQYPVYHNAYSRGHVGLVCRHHRFTAEFQDFDNSAICSQGPTVETVLIARRVTE